MSDKLKPCPFCGGESEVREAEYLGLKGFVVTCLKCGLETRLMENKNQAVWLWNRRADDMVDDKKIPMAVIYDYDGYADGAPPVDDVAHCPTCAYRFEEGREPWGRKYCPNCGQRIKWKWEE